MRRFVMGLLVGIAVGLVVAWWRLGRVGQAGLSDLEREPMRIALPDMPWEDEEAELSVAEPVATELAEAQERDEVALARARAALAGPDPLLAYCARCRAKRPIQDPEPTATSDGRPALRGTCPECGAKMFRFVSY